LQLKISKGYLDEKRNIGFDGAWKQALRSYFKDFIELCWPELLDKIDWTKKPEMLEDEMHALIKKEEIDKRIADKIIKFWRTDGVEVFALIHIEVQLSKQIDFSERMFIYRYRIFDMYKKDIASLAILIDGNKNWRPNEYCQDFCGSKLKFEYPILKILDYKDKKDELKQSKNPFVIIILAQLAAIETSGKLEEKLISKFNLTKFLYTHGLDREIVLTLLRFIDKMLALNEEFSLKYISQVKQLEGESKFSFITNAEQMWLNKGINQGVLQGETHILVHLLKAKFEELPDEYMQKVHEASPDILTKWAINVLQANALEDVFKQ